MDLWRNGSASDSRSEGCVFDSRQVSSVMADRFGDVIGEMVKYAVQTIKKGRDFGPTLKTSIETLKVLVPLKKDEDLQRHLAVHVQVANKTDLKTLLVKVEEILERLDGNQVRGLCGAPEEPQCMGMNELLTQLRIEMMKDGVLVRVLTGLGGSGKSTLAKKLCSDPQIKGKFGTNIFFVTVSKTPNWKIIAQTLFEYCGLRVPEFNNDEDAINRLTSLLSDVGKNPILLVLDDVWPGSESLVEKFKFEMPDYKILVTSRDAFRRFGTPFKLDPLDLHHAVTLFQHFAQLNVSSLFMPDNNLLHEIVKGCKGSPLALQVIAGSLCQQPFEKWQNMKEFFQYQSILESKSYFPNNSTDTDLLCHLQQSLDSLEDINKKECFMDLGLFPDDQRIPVTVLVDMWRELYNLDEDGTKAMAIVHDLNTRNLINVTARRKVATETYMYYNNHYVTMHDLLRHLAILQSKGESFEQRKRLIINLNGGNRPDWWIRPNQHGIITCIGKLVKVKQKQLKVAARILSISNDETFSSDWCDMQPDEAEFPNIPNIKIDMPNVEINLNWLHGTHS
ncbi:putative disease resistance protein [Trifolium repens]|nr:putative disease resistance protein [Trifolium repens]